MRARWERREEGMQGRRGEESNEDRGKGEKRRGRDVQGKMQEKRGRPQINEDEEKWEERDARRGDECKNSRGYEKGGGYVYQ
jgi:hypothetical protein